MPAPAAPPVHQDAIFQRQTVYPSLPEHLQLGSSRRQAALPEHDGSIGDSQHITLQHPRLEHHCVRRLQPHLRAQRLAWKHVRGKAALCADTPGLYLRSKCRLVFSVHELRHQIYALGPGAPSKAEVGEGGLCRRHLDAVDGAGCAAAPALQHMLGCQAVRAQPMQDGPVEAAQRRKLRVNVQWVVVAVQAVQRGLRLAGALLRRAGSTDRSSRHIIAAL